MRVFYFRHKKTPAINGCLGDSTKAGRAWESMKLCRTIMIIADRLMNVNMWPAFHQLRQRLHRGGGWSYFWTPDTGDYYTTADGVQMESKRSLWFPADKTPQPPSSWAGHIYFGVHPTAEPGKNFQRSTIKTIAAINCTFAEIDGKDMVRPTDAQLAAALATVEADDLRRVATGELIRPNPPTTQKRMAYRLAQETEFKRDIPRYNQLAYDHVMTMTPAPSVIIHSGGGWHLYWFLAETFHLRTDEDRNRAKRLQQKWVTFVGGDDGAKDLARVLRPIGTLNKKAKYAPNYPVVSALRMDYDREYALAELEALLPADPEKPARRVSHGTPQPAVNSTEAGAVVSTDVRSYKTVWGATNATVPVTPLIEGYGYTPHGERHMRPGGILGDSTPSVVVDELRNTVTTFSSRDPLFNEDYHPNAAFDIIRIWEHDGDFKKATVACAKRLGMEMALPDVAMKAVAMAKTWLTDVDLSAHVADEYKALCVGKDGIEYRRYTGGDTDKKIAYAVLAGMHRAGHAWRYETSYRQIATTRNSDGVPVMVKSPATVGKALARLGFMFDVTQEEKRTVITLRRDFVAVVVSRLNTSKDLSDFLEVFNLDTTTTETDALFGTLWADDAYAVGGAPLPRSIWRAMKETVDRRAFEAAFPAGLSCFAIPMIAGLLDAAGSGATIDELQEASGASKGRVGTILRTLRQFGLVESHRQFKAPSIHFIVPDAFKLIHDDIAPKLRTYGQGVNRLDRDLSRQIDQNERRLGGDLTEEEEQQVRRRAERAKTRRIDTQKAIAEIATIGANDIAAAWDALTMTAAATLGVTEERAQWEIGESITVERPRVILPSDTPKAPAMTPGELTELAWNELTTITGLEAPTEWQYYRLRELDELLGAGVLAHTEEQMRETAKDMKLAGMKGAKAYNAALDAGYWHHEAAIVASMVKRGEYAN
jgi:DNA-binding transcriptional regulator GbsR (MarR family)